MRLGHSSSRAKFPRHMSQETRSESILRFDLHILFILLVMLITLIRYILLIWIILSWSTYFAYFACFGLVLPFLPYWMVSRGLDAQEAALILSSAFISKVFFGLGVGILADATGHKKRWILLLSVFTFLGFAVLMTVCHTQQLI